MEVNRTAGSSEVSWQEADVVFALCGTSSSITTKAAALL